MDSVPVGPSLMIPSRSSLTITDRRRRSLPLRSAPALSRRSANHVNVKPASAEVISSLISTLSAISQPIYHHSDYLPEKFPRSTPSSPPPQPTEFARITRPTGDVEERDPAQPTAIKLFMESNLEEVPTWLKENAHLYPNQSTNTSPRYNPPKSKTPKKTIGSESSTSCLKREEGWDDTPSIGHLSIEPRPRLSVVSTASTESVGRKSLRSFRSLNFRSSKEGIMEEVKSIGETDLVALSPDGDGAQMSGENNIDSKTPPLSSIASDITLARKSLATGHKKVEMSTPHTDADHRDITLGSRRLSAHNSGAVANLPMVPTRESSLRCSYGEKPSHRKQKLYRRDSSGYQESIQSVVEPYQDSVLPASPDNVDVSEGDVSRRIKELRDQKRVRDRSGAIEEVDSGGTEGTFECNHNPSTQPDPYVFLSGTIYDSQGCQISEGEGNGDKEASESSAPSPAIVQRINRNSSSRMSSVAVKGTSVKASAPGRPNCEPQRENTAPPKRSNSRMLKRLSRPPSPLNSEKHKRSSSNPVNDQRPASTNSVDKAVESYISSSRLSQKVFHPETGRTISFSEVGDPNGSAILCCVGMGLTRYITAFYDELASTLKLRLITPDRPGVGGSDSHADGSETPLGWPDDVLIICQHLKLTKFSILAHSAGAIYALATALRMPQHIRGRIHLLAPWIPPSQMAAFGTQQEALPVSSLPYTQRFLRSLPTPFLRAANSSFLSTTSTSITTRLSKTPRQSKHKNIAPETHGRTNDCSRFSSSAPDYACTEASLSKEAVLLDDSRTNRRGMGPLTSRMAKRESESIYDRLLTEAIWNAATVGANPAVDLLVCLERRQSIGFRYVDITRSVVIHHGSKDTRVPVENVKWLGKTMRRCEVRILDGEGHGLMASAAVIGGVLMEMAKEWEDWMRLVQGKSSSEKRFVAT